VNHSIALVTVVVSSVPALAQNCEDSLVGSDVALNHWFAADLELEGNELIVGDEQDSQLGAEAGAAYAFDLQGGVFLE